MNALLIYEIASWVGGIAFALSGFLAGVRRELDLMGVFIVTMLTANGGGAIRDVLVGRVPNVLQDASAFYLVFGVMALAMLLGLHRKGDIERNVWFVLSDSVGLVAFSVTGAMIGIESGLPVFGVMVLAYLTAAGGGIVRDMLVNDVPAILSSDFYGSIAIILALIIYGLHEMGWDEPLVLAAVFVAMLGLRLLAYFRGWHLPRVQL